MNIDFNNRQLWLGVGVMLALYLILVLEDIVSELKRNRYIVLSLADGRRTIDGEFKRVGETHDR